MTDQSPSTTANYSNNFNWVKKTLGFTNLQRFDPVVTYAL